MYDREARWYQPPDDYYEETEDEDQEPDPDYARDMEWDKFNLD